MQHNSGIIETSSRDLWIFSRKSYVLQVCQKSLGHVSLCSKAMLDIPMHLLLVPTSLCTYRHCYCCSVDLVYISPIVHINLSRSMLDPLQTVLP